MSRFTAPIHGFATNRVNNTRHGRSVYRSQDVPGHNVFKGYTTWKTNGHVGVGDGIDSFAPAGTRVFAICDGTITKWDNDTGKLEVIYLEADGVVAVYAHIDYLPKPERVPRQVTRGEILGAVRGDLGDPHLHFEWWLQENALAAVTPIGLRDLMLSKIEDVDPTDTSLKVVGLDGKPIGCDPQWNPRRDAVIAEIRPVVQSLGYEAHYRELEDGRQRVYLKKG